jgi:hypothetical protein
LLCSGEERERTSSRSAGKEGMLPSIWPPSALSFCLQELPSPVPT